MLQYVLAMYKYRPNSGADEDASAMELLRMIKGDNAGAGAPATLTNTACGRLRRQALLVSANVVLLTTRRVLVCLAFTTTIGAPAGPCVVRSPPRKDANSFAARSVGLDQRALFTSI